MNFIAFVKMEAMGMTQLRSLLRRQHASLLAGWIAGPVD
jgi:hypothetical protein